MRPFLLSLAGAFSALVLFAFLAVGFILSTIAAAANSGSAQGDALTLTLDLRSDMADQSPRSGLAALSGQPGFIEVLERLDAAADDNDVSCVFIRASEGPFGSARAEELRSAIQRLRAGGKTVIAHTQGGFTTNPSGYRAISAADDIWIQPGSDSLISGVALESVFIGGLLDNLLITSEIQQFYEYKGAASTTNDTGFTEPLRASMTALARSVWENSLADIAEDRGMTVADVRNTFESGPKTAEAMVAAGLMDTLGWPEDAARHAEACAGDDGELLPVASYSPPSPSGRAPKIAVVGGEGGIVTGGAADSLLGDGAAFGSDTIAGAILAAARDEEIAAIVFRIESGGGSPTAADQIWRAVERAREEHGKPVVVSMGTAAASGGYYVAAGADKIVANRTTITGSIGLVAGKLAVADAFERIGVNPETVAVGGDLASAFGADVFTDVQRDMLRESFTRTYERFTDIVAKGRGFSDDAVDAVARGRVFSGADALAAGLVDESGGYLDAIAVAKDLAEIDADADVRLVHYPERKTGLAALGGVFGASEGAARAAAVLGALAGDERLAAVVEEASLARSAGPQARLRGLVER